MANRFLCIIPRLAVVRNSHYLPATRKESEVLLPVKDMTEAVRSFIGESYNDINCYELLVKGLRQMDIQYGWNRR
ncbi:MULTISPECIES: hypothetical protein [Desulfosediminicola]|uniref:hypothetical protein n=1 Tax=Desulfosediminicola TaxID=2886823 RepID=UPI0010ACD592|nr:hypothetical protein [Desulfosediminicola ganghwensis]